MKVNVSNKVKIFIVAKNKNPYNEEENWLEIDR